ncbi:hypothetical protein DDZ14_14650 [Maritimibacter sp. 55A14]|uniref:hypothetical protein n=1 Tax=Maritimibacter sp. 55A14 TaxID=2174844 RepID=UPI000D60CFF9|nr:hypothetical protein [Maritimibacter sp. 55A14]PWE30668.1 hypothetical protein DDZ14_14650 [Maritimibacter sp. 55A14]
MSELNELEGRIRAALDRIAAGLDAGTATGGDRNAALTAALERAEATVQETGERIAKLEEKVAGLMEHISLKETQIAQLGNVNAELRASNAKLREQNEAMLGDADAVEEGLRAELHALTVARQAEAAEIDAILRDLKPLLEQEAANA